MLYYVSKSNIELHEGAFSTFDEAEKFGREWLEKHFNSNQFNEPTPCCKIPQTLVSTKWGVRKTRYRNAKHIYVKCTYIIHYDFGDKQHTAESTVLVIERENGAE